MKSVEFITLEGTDYNLLRAGESLAREDFGRPENREFRQRHFEMLFPKIGDVSLDVVPSEPPSPSELL